MAYAKLRTWSIYIQCSIYIQWNIFRFLKVRNPAICNDMNEAEGEYTK